MSHTDIAARKWNSAITRNRKLREKARKQWVESLRETCEQFHMKTGVESLDKAIATNRVTDLLSLIMG